MRPCQHSIARLVISDGQASLVCTACNQPVTPELYQQHVHRYPLPEDFEACGSQFHPDETLEEVPF